MKYFTAFSRALQALQAVKLPPASTYPPGSRSETLGLLGLDSHGLPWCTYQLDRKRFELWLTALLIGTGLGFVRIALWLISKTI